MISPGATVAEGQAIMELETDKAVVEVPSSLSGTVKDVLVKQGEKIKVGQVIFTIDNGSGSVARAPSAAKAAPAAPTNKPEEPKPEPPKAQAPKQAANQSRTVTAEATAIAEFKLPELGENIHQGDLVRLMISPGAQVSEGQPVIELETDKAVVEVPS